MVDRGKIRLLDLKDTQKEVMRIEKEVSEIFTSKRNLGLVTADFLTKWVGSWTFILGLFIFLGTWMGLNLWIATHYAAEIMHDPFPFILLNLILSCLAATQAPIILMSQNREAQRDRARLEYDYRVNRKAEREIEQIKKQLDRIERRLNK